MKPLFLSLDLLGALAVFLYGLKVMSEGLQKAAGSRLREIISKATSNPVKGTISGFLVTCAVQSSSATTVMVVGFISAGLLSLYESLGIIYGANIGTTTTGWLVSLLGFKIKVSHFALPLLGIGFFIQFIRKWHWPNRIGQALVGFGLLFLGLHLMKNAIPDMRDAPQVIEWMTRFSPHAIGPRMLCVLVGTVLTMIFQSSSAVMAVTLTVAAKGLIDFPTAAALILGQNIGTTITAILASIDATNEARRAAVAHFLFNAAGSIWPILLFGPFLRVLEAVLPGSAYGTDPHTLLFVIPTHLAAFHTAFNIVNTILFLPMTRQLEKACYLFIPKRKEKQERELVFLQTAIAGTPELAVPAAQKEVDRMAGIAVGMLRKIQLTFKTERRKLPRLLESILRDEQTTDALEHSINEYLSELTHTVLSSDANKEVISLLSMINDLERIGDHGEKLAILIERKSQARYKFSEKAFEDLKSMADRTGEILEAARSLILKRASDPMPEAVRREEELNKMRDRLRKAQIERMARRECNAMAGVIFTDMLTSFEKMGDHAFNIVEAAAGIK